MVSKKILYEGKAKQLFETKKPFELVQFFKDDATAFNKKKHEIIDSKGVLNNLISEFIFTYLGNNNIPNHFIERLGPREQLIKKVEIIPIEVVVRNIAAGTFSNRFGIEEGENLDMSFSLSHLKNICLYSKISKEIEVNLTRDYPIKLIYTLDHENAKAMFYLAPKIDND